MASCRMPGGAFQLSANTSSVKPTGLAMAARVTPVAKSRNPATPLAAKGRPLANSMKQTRSRTRPHDSGNTVKTVIRAAPTRCNVPIPVRMSGARPMDRTRSLASVTVQ
ncbi:hypothetical protein D3C87_1913300 [compost metagenome]